MYDTTNNGDISPQTETETECPSNEQNAEAETAAPPNTRRTVQEPVKTLRERGISSATKRHFGIEDYAGVGLRYATKLLDGTVGPRRFKGIAVGEPCFAWSADASDSLPTIYNLDVLQDAERMQERLFLLQHETEVWPMHQSGLAAIALFEAPDEEAENFAARIEELGGYLSTQTPHREVQLLFDHDERGRCWALAAKTTLEQFGIRCHLLSLGSVGGATLGLGVGDLFESVGFEVTKFREELAMLQLVPPREMEQWRNDPTMGLPEIQSDDEELLLCLNEAQLEALPEPDCLIQDTLLSGGVTLMTGRENLGKSALAIAMGASVSLGIPWCGQPTNAGLVFYIAAEGANGINKRLKAWKVAMNITDLPNFRVLPMSVAVYEEAARERLIKTIQHHARIAREQAVEQGLEAPEVALVIIDTLAKTRGNLDENSQGDMTMYLEGLNELKERVGPAVLVLHHNNRAGEFRGSSSLTANADGHLLLIGESGGPQIVLKVAKLKDFADGQQYVLRRQIIDLGVGKNGKPQTSVV